MRVKFINLEKSLIKILYLFCFSFKIHSSVHMKMLKSYLAKFLSQMLSITHIFRSKDISNDKSKYQRIDTLLKSWGVISGHYRPDGTIQKTTKGRRYQTFVISYQFLYAIKFIISMFIRDDSIWVYYTADFCAMYSLWIPRRIYVFVLLLVSLKSLIIQIHYRMFENENRNIKWLGIHYLIEGKF